MFDSFDIHSLDLSVMPVALQELITCVGIDAALKIVEAHPGQVIYVPMKPIVGHSIEQLIGHEKFALFCKQFGGQHDFYVPKMDKVKKQIKEKIAIEMHGKGVDTRTISLEIGCSRRHAQRLLSPLKDDTNLDLFE